MNKIEYLNALKQALKDTDQSVMEEIVSDYDEHFQVGIENGKSEQQICEELGSIDDLVKEIKEVYNTESKECEKEQSKDDKRDNKIEDNKDEEKIDEVKIGENNSQEDKKEEDKKTNDDQANSNYRKNREWYFDFNNIDSDKISNVINSALDSASEVISNINVKEISNTLKNTFDQAASSFNNFADSYIKNQGSDPFDFNKKNAEGYKDNVFKSYDDSDDPINDATSNNSVIYDAEPNDESTAESTNFSQSYMDQFSQVNEKGCKTSDNEQNINKAEKLAQEEVEEQVQKKINEQAQEKVEEQVQEKVEEQVQEKVEEQAQEKVEEQVQEKIEEQVQEKVEEQDQEKVEGQSQENDEAFSKKDKKGLNIVIDGICADIAVTKSSNGKINLNYENNGNERQKQMYEFYSYKEGNTVYAGIRKVGKVVFLYNHKVHSIHINVELPENISNVNIKAASGNIKFLNTSADRIVAETASGDVSINQVYATDLGIKCFSGDIEIYDVNSTLISASTMSGDLEANNLESQELSLKSSSGNLKVRNIVGNIIDNSTISGDLDINNMKANQCKIRSTSGDIVINEFTMINADVSSISGDLKLSNLLGDGLRAKSTSGEVILDVNVKRCHASSKSGDVEVKCNGDVLLESSSTSGNVNVYLKNYGNGYCVKTKTISGELYINYNNERQRNLKTGTYTYGNQGSELILGTVSGDIHLND